MVQQYTSEKTSINTVTKIYNKINFEPGTIVLDYGGGKYDTNTEHLADLGVRCVVYDPYNRTSEHNRLVMEFINDIEGADYVVCANVINVIKEDYVVTNILEKLKGMVCDGGTIYVQVYEGDKSGVGRETTKGYQRNQKAADYAETLQQVYGKGIKRKENIFEIRR